MIPERSPGSYPKISVVLPIRNEADFIALTIRYLQNQDYPRDKLEILVVVGDSTDSTAEIVQQIASVDDRVKYFHNPKNWSSAARNIGAKAATGEIITYVDGHTYIDNDQLLKSTARLMEENNVSVLSRPQILDTPENTTFQKVVACARKSPLGHGLDSTIYSEQDMLVNPSSAGASYKREVFDTVGFFDESFDASEDYEFNYRVSQAGYQAFTSLKLAVYYYPRRSLGALFKQMVRYGRGRMRFVRKHPSALSLGMLIPPLFALGIPACPLLFLIWPLLARMLLIVLVVYLSVLVVVSTSLALGNGLSSLPLLLVIFPAIHLGLGWGFLCELWRSLRPGRGHPSTKPDSQDSGSS